MTESFCNGKKKNAFTFYLSLNKSFLSYRHGVKAFIHYEFESASIFIHIRYFNRVISKIKQRNGLIFDECVLYVHSFILFYSSFLSHLLFLKIRYGKWPIYLKDLFFRMTANSTLTGNNYEMLKGTFHNSQYIMYIINHFTFHSTPLDWLLFLLFERKRCHFQFFIRLHSIHKSWILIILFFKWLLPLTYSDLLEHTDNKQKKKKSKWLFDWKSSWPVWVFHRACKQCTYKNSFLKQTLDLRIFADCWIISGVYIFLKKYLFISSYIIRM